MPQSAAAKAAFRRILFRSVFVPVIVMTMLAVGLIVQVGQLTGATKMVEHTDAVISRLYQLEKTLVDMQAGVRGFIISGSDDYLEPYTAGKDQLHAQIAEVAALTSDRDEAQKHVRVIDALAGQWLTYAQGRIAARRANDANELARFGPGNVMMNDIRREFDAFIAEESQLRDQRNEATRRLAKWTIIGTGGITVLVGAFLSLLSRGQLRWLSSTYEASLTRSRELSEQLERRVAERTGELAASNEKLNEANKELEAFAYSVSHDLRAPMRHISGFAQLLQMSNESKLSPDDVDNLQTINRTALLAGRMVDDLLAFSRIGRTKLRSDPVDMDATIQTCLRELAPELASRKIEWTIAPLPPAIGDAGLIKLSFDNLLSNAVKYTGSRQVAHIEVGSRAEEGGITYFVKDDGVGFDMAYAHKLFGVFQRLHRAEEFEGTGIGLANVRRIIGRHGGKTWAEGVPGVGATFFVHLPATPIDPAATAKDEVNPDEPEANPAG